LTLRLLEADDLAAALPMEAAIDALEQAFRGSLPEAPQRTRVPIDGSDLLLMPATGAPGAGVKLVTINPQNPGRDLPLIHGAYVLFAPNTLATVGSSRAAPSRGSAPLPYRASPLATSRAPTRAGS
jgi:ornithine cyclodeaminase/alanine dehydrogenase-like protein (mu-crystallin family)